MLDDILWENITMPAHLLAGRRALTKLAYVLILVRTATSTSVCNAASK